MISNAATQAQNQVQGGFLLHVVVCKRLAVLQLLAAKNQTLLVRRNALLVTNLVLHLLDGVRCLHIQRDGFASEGLDEHLHF